MGIGNAGNVASFRRLTAIARMTLRLSRVSLPVFAASVSCVALAEEITPKPIDFSDLPASFSPEQMVSRINIGGLEAEISEAESE